MRRAVAMARQRGHFDPSGIFWLIGFLAVLLLIALGVGAWLAWKWWTR